LFGEMLGKLQIRLTGVAGALKKSYSFNAYKTVLRRITSWPLFQ
jgi:hypothetical protein